MAKTIKMADMTGEIAAKVFEMLNDGKVKITNSSILEGMFYIVTAVEPKDLFYPEGWYYAKGFFRNKHNSSNGVYHEIEMIKPTGESWKRVAMYSTQE